MAFDLQPHLKGELIDLRPLKPDDWKELFAVASDPFIWEQHPESDRHLEDVFKIFFSDALESRGAFVILDRMTQQIIGSTRFYGYDPEKSEIEIWLDISGEKILGRPVQRGNETIIAESRLQVCRERCILRRRRQHSLSKGDGKSWRDQSRNGDTGLRKSSAGSEFEVCDEEAVKR